MANYICPEEFIFGKDFGIKEQCPSCLLISVCEIAWQEGDWKEPKKKSMQEELDDVVDKIKNRETDPTIDEILDSMIQSEQAATMQQQMPDEGHTNVLPEVISDFIDRDRMGTKKYGTTLQTHNGRDPLVDLLQELMDAIMYLKQHLLERDNG